jgi:hypothetical protein
MPRPAAAPALQAPAQLRALREPMREQGPVPHLVPEPERDRVGLAFRAPHGSPRAPVEVALLPASSLARPSPRVQERPPLQAP